MRRVAHVAFAIACVGFVWLFFPAVARSQSNCMDQEVFIGLAQSSPAYASHQVLEGDERKLADELFNSIPPATDETHPTIILVSRRDGSGAMFLGPVGRVCTLVMFPADRWKALLRYLRGGNA